MKALQSLPIITLIFGLAISTAYAQDAPNNDTITVQPAGTTSNVAQTKPTTIRIGETWEQHLQKAMEKEAAAQKAQGNAQGQ